MAGENSTNMVGKKAEVARLIAMATQRGDPDSYTGKRQSVRVSEGIQLEVTTDPNDPAVTWGVSMHDVSKGGISFWSKRDLKPFTYVHVREFSSRTGRLWLPAQVKHRTVGIRGYLIGASFVLADAPGNPGRRQSQMPRPAGPPNFLPPGRRSWGR